MADTQNDTTANNTRHAQHKGKSAPLFDFDELFGNQSMVLIRLGSEVYELRKTKTGKLVLNK